MEVLRVLQVTAVRPILLERLEQHPRQVVFRRHGNVCALTHASGRPCRDTQQPFIGTYDFTPHARVCIKPVTDTERGHIHTQGTQGHSRSQRWCSRGSRMHTTRAANTSYHHCHSRQPFNLATWSVGQLRESAQQRRCESLCGFMY